MDRALRNFASILVVALTAVFGAGTPRAAEAPAASGLSPAAATHLKEVLASYMGPTKFVAPAPPIDPAPLKGKLILTIPASTAIPWCDVVDRQLEDFAKRVGIRMETWQNNAQLGQWVQGFDTAISHQAALINVACGLEPASVAPQIKRAIGHRVPVIAAHDYALGQPTLPDLSGIVYGNYIEAAKLESDWVMQQTDGKANVLVIVAPSVANSPYIQNTITAEFAQYCPSCKLRFIRVNPPDWPTKIEPQVRSAIIADHALNYVIPIYDGMAQFVVSAIIGTGAGDRVKVATFNALPAVLNMIRTGNIVTFEVGEDTTWLAGAILDQDMRVLLKKPLVPDYVAGLRIFTKANVADAGVPAKFGQGYGPTALPGYEALWGLH